MSFGKSIIVGAISIGTLLAVDYHARTETIDKAVTGTLKDPVNLTRETTSYWLLPDKGTLTADAGHGNKTVYNCTKDFSKIKELEVFASRSKSKTYDNSTDMQRQLLEEGQVKLDEHISTIDTYVEKLRVEKENADYQFGLKHMQ